VRRRCCATSSRREAYLGSSGILSRFAAVIAQGDYLVKSADPTDVRFAPMYVIQSCNPLSRKRSSFSSRRHGLIQNF
jgi:hypothetical protein